MYQKNQKLVNIFKSVCRIKNRFQLHVAIIMPFVLYHHEIALLHSYSDIRKTLFIYKYRLKLYNIFIHSNIKTKNSNQITLVEEFLICLL
jgi:hypothetical protein